MRSVFSTKISLVLTTLKERLLLGVYLETEPRPLGKSWRLRRFVCCIKLIALFLIAKFNFILFYVCMLYVLRFYEILTNCICICVSY